LIAYNIIFGSYSVFKPQSHEILMSSFCISVVSVLVQKEKNIDDFDVR